MGKKRLLIIGDTIIDHDVYLNAIGLSLESPTLKTVFQKEKHNFGGAANVARYAFFFGADVTFISSLTEVMAQCFMVENSIQLLNVKANSDTIKTRNYISKGDREYNYLQINRVNDTACGIEFIENIQFNSFDVVAISDYRCGFLTKSVVEKIRQKSTILYAASQLSDKNPNYDLYGTADFLVCNVNESKYLNNVRNVFITHGDKGCSFNGVTYPGNPVKVARTIGAGDVFFAALLASGSPKIANDAASSFVAGEIQC